MIDGGNLQDCADTFRALDTDKSGSIDRRDLEELERQHLQEIAKELGHTALDVTSTQGHGSEVPPKPERTAPAEAVMQ